MTQETAQKIEIDGEKFDATDMNDQAKELLQSIQYVDGMLVKLNNQLAIYDTAKIAYANALKNSRPE